MSNEQGHHLLGRKKATTDTPDCAAHLPIVDSSATHAQRSLPAPPIALPLRADADDDERRSSAGKRKHVISLGSLECAATQYAQVLDDQERGRCRRSHAPASAPPLSTSGGSQAARCSPTAQELHSCSDSTDTPTRTPNISDTPTRTPSPGTAGHLSTNEMTSSAATLAHHLAPPLSPPLSPPALIPHRMCWHGRSSEDPELLKDGGEQPQVLIQASDDDWHRRSPAWYWHNLLPLLCYTCPFDVQDWASLNTRWTHMIPEAPFVAAMPIIYIWFGMIACNFVMLGPQTDKRQPLAIQLAGAALVCVHCLLAIRRFQLVGQPAVMEELAGFMKPMLDAIVGAAIQSAASLGGVAPWTCVRARIGLMGATGVLCSTSLWFWTAGRATRYPPGPIQVQRRAKPL